MKKICVYLAVFLVLTVFGMTMFAHAGDLMAASPAINADSTVPEVSTEYEVPITLDPSLTTLTLSETELSLIYKSTAKLTASVDVTWTSDNERVVKVAEAGKTAAECTLTAEGRGTAHVTAKTADGRTATCTVTVNYTILQWIIRIFLFGWIWY